MENYIQEPPFCIQVELTEGCNLQCSFCGIQGIREKSGGPFKFLTLAIAETVAKSIAKAGWTSRIEFAMHGEPSMNPEREAIVRAFRTALPRNQIMMTSNGGGLLAAPDKSIAGLFAAGLNILALDNYKSVPIVPKILDRYTGDIPIHHYPAEGLELSPHRRWPGRTKVIIIIQDLLEAAAGSHAVITNHCGCGSAPTQIKATQRCAKPFRELGVRWDGSIAGCCNDWRGVVKVGNAATNDIAKLWQGPVLNAMRHKLYAGERDFGACDGCDYVSYRNGLLPDKLGKLELPAPTAVHNRVLKAATANGTLTQIVLRPWEK